MVSRSGFTVRSYRSGVGAQPREQVRGLLLGAPGDVLGALGARVPLDGQVPAVDEPGHLVVGELACLQDRGALDGRAEIAAGAGRDDVVVARVVLDLALDPADDDAAGQLVGDLVETVEEDEALTGLQALLEPAGRFLLLVPSQSRPDHLGERQPFVGHEVVRDAAQVQQHGNVAPRALLGQAGAAGRVPQERGLAGAGRADDGEDGAALVVEEVGDRAPFVGGVVGEHVLGDQAGGPEGEADVDVDLVEFGRVVPDGGQSLLVHDPQALREVLGVHAPEVAQAAGEGAVRAVQPASAAQHDEIADEADGEPAGGQRRRVGGEERGGEEVVLADEAGEEAGQRGRGDEEREEAAESGQYSA
ncbi:hypothetical protein OFY01_10920 [Streptomyces sp. GXMU-J5]|uniref:Uncharacterized protein n=1 Tax=Streptomyces beihaiensis TaxID=2984495 RepID=A0ABT3TTB5_9ACTN|nr:hypothetical protein [Streptomyces beihaiensis]MCX3060257.1 hypothetical protein [Streptomyces beihaiensis]